MTLHKNVHEVIQLLESGSFDPIVGRSEDQHLEFKSAPYRLDSDSGRFELAKDVSAFANIDSGIIIIGVQTEKHPTVALERARSVHPFQEVLISQQQLKDVIIAWTYPPLRGFDVKWYPSSKDPKNGLAGIIIAGEEEQRPYLTTKIVDEHGKILGTQFGYFRRWRGENAPAGVSELHALLQDGVRFRRAVALGAPQATGETSQVRTAQRFSKDVVNQRIARSISETGFDDKSVYVLAAYPEHPLELPDILESSSGLTVAFDKPPERRYAGFDLTTDRSSELIQGELRRSVIPGYKNREIWRDGLIVFLAAADDDYLCWGSHKRRASVVNPLALTESILLFVEYVKGTMEKASEVPHTVNLECRLRRFKDKDAKPLVIVPFKLGTVGWEFMEGREARPAPDVSELNMKKPAVLDLGKPEINRAGYEVLREFYAWFGVNADEIPYTCESPIGRAVDPSAVWKAD